MNLIDKDAIPWTVEGVGEIPVVTKEEIDEMPTIDAVPVIRCKDCKHHFYEHDDIPYCANIDYGYGWRDEDYCSKAERKE